MCYVFLMAASFLTPLAPAPADIRPGTISVVAAGGREAEDRVTPIFVDAVEHAVLRTRFLPLPNPSHSRYIATVDVSQTPRGIVETGGGRSSGSPNLAYGGGGLSLSLPSNKGQLRGLVLTRLTVNVSLRGSDGVVWTGQAVTIRVSGSRNGELPVVAATLSDALFSQFPNHLNEPISVP